MATVNSSWVDKAYEGKTAAEVADAPVSALQGVSAGDAEKLQKAFGINSVRGLARLAFVRWSQEIAAGGSGTVNKDHVDKAYEGKSKVDVAAAPVDALQGVSAGDAALLKAAFDIDTVADLANSKYVKWAQDIVKAAG
jgi:hypothetical protein